MELSPGAQLVQAMSALFFGGALGAVYDVLRAVRRVLKRRAYAFDALFCLCVLSALMLNLEGREETKTDGSVF